MPEIDLPTVIFALVALFVAWKLRSVLGMRQDLERPGESYGPPAPRSRPGERACRAAGRGAFRADFAGARGPLERRRRARSGGLERPRRHCRRRSQLHAEAFLAGARGAYDMVVHAFAAGDSDALKSLMSPEAFANFESAIHARADAGHTMSTTVVSIDNATIVGARLIGATAQLQVRFSAKLASVTRDTQGEVIDGSPNNVVEHIDLWTFARDVRSRDPNWQLTATESER